MPYALAVGGSFQGVSAADLQTEPFTSLVVSGSAQDFRDWLLSQFPSEINDSPRRIA
jgi:hypothetical protein